MSLYHFSVKQVSRGKGQTVVGSAAYISKVSAGLCAGSLL